MQGCLFWYPGSKNLTNGLYSIASNKGESVMKTGQQSVLVEIVAKKELYALRSSDRGP